MDIYGILRDTARRLPDRPVFAGSGPSRTYADLEATVRRRAAFLRSLGVRQGHAVAILDRNGPAYLECYFAIAALGAVAVPLNSRLAAAEVRQVLDHAGVGIALVGGDLALEDPGEVAIHEIGSAVASTSALELPAIEPDDAAHLYYTSGSTGRPKGVTLTHRNVCTHAAAAVGELDLASSDTWAHIAPMFHLADAWATFAITMVGGRHAFLPQFEPAAALRLLVDAEVTITNLVPTMLNLMVQHPSAGTLRFPALRAMLSGGAPIAATVVRKILSVFGCDYVQTYGMTETSPYLTLSLLHDHLRELPLEARLHYICKTGRPFAGVELRVVAADGTPVAADGTAIGEIEVRGATVTPGYWRDPAATAAAFTSDGFLRTGDLATIDGEGYVDIVDRKKDVILTGGETVYCVEVEARLYEDPAVIEAAVFGRPDPTWGEVVCAAVATRVPVTAAHLQDHCRATLAAFKTPRQIEFLPALPRLGSGKIDKATLRG